MHLPPIYNCSNDMALAANVRQYFPPRRIQQMETDVAGLSRFWDEGPWGWSLATKQRYIRMGIPESELPSDEWLEGVRQLSSRRFAAEYLLHLLADAEQSGRGHFFVKDDGEFPRIYKSLWSSSGRGVVVARSMSDDIERRLAGFQRTQGGYVEDKFYEDKTLDFAMEFWIHSDRHVEFLGYSVFETGEHGTYGGNYVESPESLLQRIDLPEDLLHYIQQYHIHHLAQMDYYGPVGIDMLKTKTQVHPVIEINLRMNMGILALNLYRRGITADQYLTPNLDHGFVAMICQGRLCIEYRP